MSAQSADCPNDDFPKRFTYEVLSLGFPEVCPRNSLPLRECVKSESLGILKPENEILQISSCSMLFLFVRAAVISHILWDVKRRWYDRPSPHETLGRRHLSPTNSGYGIARLLRRGGFKEIPLRNRPTFPNLGWYSKVIPDLPTVNFFAYCGVYQYCLLHITPWHYFHGRYHWVDSRIVPACVDFQRRNQPTMVLYVPPNFKAIIFFYTEKGVKSFWNFGLAGNRFVDFTPFLSE